MDFRLDFFVLPVAALLLTSPILAQAGAQGQSTSTSASGNTTSSSAQHVRKAAPAADSRLDAGSVSKGEYRNPGFGFTCKIPSGWVLRTEEMNAREDGQPEPDVAKAQTVKTQRVLLAAFSRPPEARGEDVNSSIVIAAESAAAIPELKEAAQYFGLVSKAAEAQGFELDDDAYEFVIGTKTLVRGDFHKDVGTRVMRQSTLVILARGYAVSFTFIGGTEDEVEELIAGLSFGVGAKPHQP
jgi:hypothetical protein